MGCVGQEARLRWEVEAGRAVPWQRPRRPQGGAAPAQGQQCIAVSHPSPREPSHELLVWGPSCGSE